MTVIDGVEAMNRRDNDDENQVSLKSSKKVIITLENYLSQLNSATYLAIATIILSTLRAIILQTWGRFTIPTQPSIPMTFEEFSKWYHMPALQRIADRDASYDYKQYLDDYYANLGKDNFGLLWLEFSSQIWLLLVGLSLFVFISKTKRAVDKALKQFEYEIVDQTYFRTKAALAIYILLVIISMILDIVTMSLYYPGIFFSPSTGFGIWSSVRLILVYSYLLGHATYLLWLLEKSMISASEPDPVPDFDSDIGSYWGHKSSLKGFEANVTTTLIPIRENYPTEDPQPYFSNVPEKKPFPQPNYHNNSVSSDTYKSSIIDGKPGHFIKPESLGSTIASEPRTPTRPMQPAYSYQSGYLGEKTWL